jgi:hypothetical protein
MINSSASYNDWAKPCNGGVQGRGQSQGHGQNVTNKNHNSTKVELCFFLLRIVSTFIDFYKIYPSIFNEGINFIFEQEFSS